MKFMIIIRICFNKIQIVFVKDDANTFIDTYSEDNNYNFSK